MRRMPSRCGWSSTATTRRSARDGHGVVGQRRRRAPATASGRAGRPTLRFDRRRVLVDPHATEVWFADGHRRDDARPGRYPVDGATPLAVASPWPAPRPPRHTSRPLVVYEAHVRGLTKRRDRDDGGTFIAAVDELPRLAALGRERARTAAGPPVRSRRGELLGIHGARVRGGAPPVRGRRRRRRRSSPISSPPPTITTSRSGSTSCSTTRPRRTSSARRTTCGPRRP